MVGAHDDAGPHHPDRLGDHRGFGRAVLVKVRRAAQRVLPVRRHDLAPARTALVRVADPALELPQQPHKPLRAPARPVLGRVEQRLHERRGLEPDSQEPEPEAPAQRQRVLPASRTAGERRHRKIHVVGEALPRNPLEHQRQREPGLQLDDDRRLVAANGHQVAAVHLALHGIALRFQESLDRRVEIGFTHGMESATGEPGVKGRPSTPHPVSRSTHLQRQPGYCNFMCEIKIADNAIEILRIGTVHHAARRMRQL